MAKLRLLIGTAGSGKTHAVLDEAARLAAESPLPTPGHPPVLVIVPEQQAVQIERALLKRLADMGRPAASARLRVASLTRFARLLRQNSGMERRQLSELGRRLLCWRLLPEGRENKARAGGLAAVLGSLASYGTTPTDLTAATTALGAGSGGEIAEPSFQQKLAEIGDVYQRYEQHCAELGLEFISPVEEIPALLATPPWTGFELTSVFIDGFSGFTPPEEQAVAAIAAACAAVTGTVLIDPARAAGPLPPDPADWYEPTRGLLMAWERIADTLECAIDKQVLTEPRRWPANPALGVLAMHGTAADVDGVTAVAAAAMRAEVDAAAARILDLAAGGARFREVSVITHRLDPYADLVAARFADAGIPVFIDRRRELKHHPTVEYFRCSVRLALGLAEPDELHTWLKTGLAPVPDGADAQEVIDRLDAYGRDFDLQPWQWLGDRAWTRHRKLLPPLDGVARVTAEERVAAEAELALLDGWRRTVLVPVAQAGSALRGLGRQDSVLASVIDALWRELVAQPLDGRLEEIDMALSAGHAGQYIPVGEVLEQIAGLLAEMAQVAGGEAVQPVEFAGWLEYGLGSLTHAQPPPVLDAVLVTEAERGRNPEVRHTLLLGLSEGVWPASIAEPPLLSDRERALLNGGGRMLIAGGAEEAAARGPYNLLVAATRPSHSLYLSRPLAAADGRVLRPSPYFDMLAEQLGFAPAEVPRSGRVISIGDLAGLSRLHRADQPLAGLARRLLDGCGPGGRGASVETGLAWGARIAELAGSEPSLDAAQLFGMAAPGEHLTLRMSASRLEQFAACPFKHYANYFLGLDDRSPSEFTPALLGSLYHRIFDLAVERLAEGGYDWLSGEPAPVRETLSSVLDGLRDEFAELANRRRAAYILERAQLLCDLHAAAMAQTAQDDQRVPRYSELRFGPEPGADLPAVRIATDAADVLLSGYIDRVDAGPGGATVVDYKLSSRKVQWDMFLAGAQLQLPVYMLALAAADTPELAPGQAEFQPVEPDWRGGDHATLKASGLPQTGRGQQDAAATAGQLDNVLHETQRIVGELAGRLAAGEIAAHPLRQGGGKWVACGSCSYRALCRFDPAAGARYRDTLAGTPTELRNRLAAGETFEGSAGGIAGEAGDG